MHRWAKIVFFLVFALTGFSALMLQVVWQRVISVHAGVDLVSFTTVVAAFLGGIGLGSLAGGWVADRLGPRSSVLAFAASNLAIGVFAWMSVWLFYDVYEQQAASLTSFWSKFAFNFILLLVPTILMGLSLPLVAKGVVERVGDAGSLVGRLYSVNTLGAAAGAAVAGWKLLGTYGFVTTTRIAGTLNVAAALLVVLVYALEVRRRAVEPSVTTVPADEATVAAATTVATAASDDDDVVDAHQPIWPWFVVYALTGAVALGFEVVFFRMIDTIMRSNSYSFAHVLSVYLLFFGGGAALASPIVRRVRRPDQWFLWLQFVVGLTALLGPIVLTKVLPRTPWGPDISQYFTTEGYAVGFRNLDGTEHSDFFQVFFGAPLLIMGLPVLCMGASFPFVQSLVSRRLDSLGRHTGLLLFSNVMGNVLGTMVVGFVIIDRWGTAGTYRVLALSLLVPALVAAYLLRGPALRRVTLAVGALVVMALLIRFFPTNEFLFATMQGRPLDKFHLAEDRSCENALKVLDDGQEEMTINGSSQNNYPFDDFHVLLGLTPTLMLDDPQHAMALGLGIGATPYGISLDPRVDKVHTVEICGPQVPLLKDLGERRAPELKKLFSDPRHDMLVGDGRDYLLRGQDPLDLVVVDTLRQQSAFSGNLYSVEFYQLVSDRLTEDGMIAEWLPTPRTLNSVLEVFPYVMLFEVPTYYNSVFFVASKKPIEFDRAEVLQRFAQMSPDSGLSPEIKASAQTFLENTKPGCLIIPENVAPLTDDNIVNRDLHPRDEYFLNNEPGVPGRSTCVPPVIREPAATP